MTSGFFLGGVIDPTSGDRTGALVDYDPGDLTTHGVIVGMTGSGKTGLGIIFLEEALRAGIPALILDPKGDMTNLLLTFPDLAPADFRPWVDEAAANREGKDPEAVAAENLASLYRRRAIAQVMTSQGRTWCHFPSFDFRKGASDQYLP